ncbi:uncharacterized protein LTR77_009962 [Saxophila tyrrhenica]|uniref:Alginate lyase domain-containing protein n=1 Tax=Saxophila tyrrhenica TaxID=1690608 RepID=A0AAV9P0H2_9PEZI|nr:hypothetical protein LTR77_009962 [Saxophila tyrrhenica]
MSRNGDLHDGQPHTVVLHQETLERTRRHHEHGVDAKLRLAASADQWLAVSSKERWSVMEKPTLAPSNSPHDYVSQAPYWWPSKTATGLPYIRRDGMINPDAVTLDKVNKAKVFQSCHILSLAWLYTGEEAYGARAATILRDWFTDERTGMSPHLEYAQMIPGRNTGRAIGIIDFAQKYDAVVDAAMILSSGCPSWSSEDHHNFFVWNEKYLDWLLYSDFGIEESQQLNNHGTFASLQKAAIAMMLGRTDTVRAEVESAKRRIDASIDPDGSQPHEVARTRSWHYSCFNLLAFARLAEIGQKTGVDLWSYFGPDGQCLHCAVDFLIPAAARWEGWRFPETKFVPYLATDLIRASALRGNARAMAVVKELQAPPLDLWEWCLVPENHDASIEATPAVP